MHAEETWHLDHHSAKGHWALKMLQPKTLGLPSRESVLRGRTHTSITCLQAMPKHACALPQETERMYKKLRPCCPRKPASCLHSSYASRGHRAASMVPEGHLKQLNTAAGRWRAS